MASHWLDELTPEEISARLETHAGDPPHNPFPPEMLDGDPKPAGVLIPLLREAGQWRALYIRRTEVEGDMHSGQVAFPGGAREPGDESIAAAALREAHEEIAIQSEDVQILGKLRDFVTISSYRVTPFVGHIPWPYPLRLHPEEVKRAFTIPLTWLYDPANRREEKREIPGVDTPASVIYFNDYDGEMLWGASARFTLSLLEILENA